jgi:hypothetical protein
MQVTKNREGCNNDNNNWALSLCHVLC